MREFIHFSHTRCQCHAADMGPRVERHGTEWSNGYGVESDDCWIINVIALSNKQNNTVWILNAAYSPNHFFLHSHSACSVYAVGQWGVWIVTEWGANCLLHLQYTFFHIRFAILILQFSKKNKMLIHLVLTGLWKKHFIFDLLSYIGSFFIP